jgi:hypothetical protein
MNSLIETNIENGKFILKKPVNSKEDFMFYNSDYFSRIGFPNAEVSIVSYTSGGKKNGEIHGEIYGGYYKNVNRLTFPFRHFVYLVQHEGDKEETPTPTPKPKDEKVEPTKNNDPDFFNRISKYGVQISETIQTFFQKKDSDKVTDKPEKTEQPKEESGEGVRGEADKVGDESAKTEQPPEDKVADEPVKTEQPKEESGEEVERENIEKPVSYYKVTIPIENDDKTEMIGKYEKEEAKLNQILREEKQKVRLAASLSSSKLKEVDSLNAIICKGVKGLDKKLDMSKVLKGSKISKYVEYNKVCIG